MALPATPLNLAVTLVKPGAAAEARPVALTVAVATSAVVHVARDVTSVRAPSPYTAVAVNSCEPPAPSDAAPGKTSTLDGIGPGSTSRSVWNVAVAGANALPAMSTRPAAVIDTVALSGNNAVGAMNTIRPSWLTASVATTAVPLMTRPTVSGETDRGSIGSEKRSAATAWRATAMAPGAGSKDTTVGAIESAAGGPISSVWPVMPVAERPPATSTSPPGTSVAVWSARAVCRRAARVLMPFCPASITSSVPSSVVPERPPATSTLPSGSSVAE